MSDLKNTTRHSIVEELRRDYHKIHLFNSYPLYITFLEDRLTELMIKERKAREDGSPKEDETCQNVIGCFLPKCTRVEVIDQSGRAYVNWKTINNVRTVMQDSEKTLKVFID